MGEGVKAKIQNLLTRTREGVSFPTFSNRSKQGEPAPRRPRTRSSIVDSATPLCHLVRRAPTRIEAVRNLGCDTASTLVSATKTMRFKKNDVNRALCSDGRPV